MCVIAESAKCDHSLLINLDLHSFAQKDSIRPKGALMSKHIFFALVVFCSATVRSQQPELRGIWVTPRTGGGIWSKADIARAMDSIANNNFNVVYFNAWSRGWPLWRSDYFLSETGYRTDPAAGERDILQEAIAEAHRRGLELEAWCEYGFVGWWSGNILPGFPKGPLFARHPDWLARKYDGSDEFDAGGSGVFYWMSHNHPHVQRFLVKLHQEIAEKYDVDGIELDRIRYPQLDCGYDSASVALYRLEFGTPPPSAGNNPQWMRWRADRLIAFHRAAYDSIKRTNAYCMVSNAPSHYSSGTNYPAYESFLQDWRAWINGRMLDGAQIQMYVQPPTLATYIPSAISGVQDSLRRKCYAGVAPRTSFYTLDAASTVQLITTSRNAGLRGHAFWYYNDLVDLGFLGVIRNQAYQTRVAVPDRPTGWRGEGRIRDDTTGNRSSGWINVQLPPTSSISAWNRNFSYTDENGNRFLEYRATIPASGFYDVYIYQVGGLLNLTSQAPYELFNQGGPTENILVDQAASINAGWYRLGTASLAQGTEQLVARVTNANIGAGKYVTADAMMLLLNRKRSPHVIINAVAQRDEAHFPQRVRLLQHYPNPFNPSARIVYHLPRPGKVELDLFDTLGRHITRLIDAEKPAGTHDLALDGGRFATGAYLIRLRSGPEADYSKILLIR